MEDTDEQKFGPWEDVEGMSDVDETEKNIMEGEVLESEIL